MLVLALDTTTRTGSAAVVRDATVLAVVVGDAERTHGERLPEELDRALREADVAREDLDLLVVASGPGAFTGLRIGLAAMQGLAMVLDRPVVGVSALDALAFAAAEAGAPRDSVIHSWMDAQRGEVFAASYMPDTRDARAWHPSEVPMVGAPDEVLAQLPRGLVDGAVFTGDGAVKYRQQIEQFAGGARLIEPPAALAVALARLGAARAAHGEAGPPHALQPLYVRRPDAELERQRRRDAAINAASAEAPPSRGQRP